MLGGGWPREAWATSKSLNRKFTEAHLRVAEALLRRRPIYCQIATTIGCIIPAEESAGNLKTNSGLGLDRLQAWRARSGYYAGLRCDTAKMSALTLDLFTAGGRELLNRIH
jgi:hypothetical protein